jgi:2-keto-4-pentenoate hydratase
MLTIADQASHGRLIIAPHLSIRADDWPAFSKNFKANPARLSINDAEVATGDGSLVLGNPLTALTWLANTLKDANMHLKADDIVTSGTMTGLTPIQHGDSVVADFGGFGKVKLQLSPLS